MQRILLVDDDEQLGQLLHSYFKGFSIDCQNAVTPTDAYARLESEAFDLIILDVMLPEQDGFDVCKQIRKTSDIPIVMLTARGEVMDRIVGLEIGADDYLPKPFEPRELLARTQSILKRIQTTPADTQRFRVGDLVFDKLAMQVTLAGSPVSLTSMEYALLDLLLAAPHQLFTRDDILNALKGIQADFYSRSVDILVSRLRQKLKPMELIKTVHGRGYLFAGEVTPDTLKATKAQ
jgi:two-component system OmpR family response regulator